MKLDRNNDFTMVHRLTWNSPKCLFFFVMSLAAVGILVYTFDLISSDMIRCILQLQHRLSHDCKRFNWEYLVKWGAADVDNVSNRLISSHSNHVASHLKIFSSEWRGMIVNDVSMNKQYLLRQFHQTHFSGLDLNLSSDLWHRLCVSL